MGGMGDVYTEAAFYGQVLGQHYWAIGARPLAPVLSEDSLSLP